MVNVTSLIIEGLSFIQVRLLSTMLVFTCFGIYSTFSQLAFEVNKTFGHIVAMLMLMFALCTLSVWF